MKFAVFGGDDRSVRLCRLLREDGHEAAPCFLEKALECVPPAEALEGAQCVVLPLPCAKGGMLNAPYCAEKVDVCAVLELIARGTVVCAGKADAISDECDRLGVKLRDYFAREDFALKNAALTAEGAVEVVMGASSGSVMGSRALVCGFGRIGMLLSLRLRALGAEVTAAARRSEARTLAECLGVRSKRLSDVRLGDYDFVINTVPEQIFGVSDVEAMQKGAILELASEPGGFTPEAAEAAGARLIRAPGLPGKCAPEAAAAAVRDTLYNIMEDEL